MTVNCVRYDCKWIDSNEHNYFCSCSDITIGEDGNCNDYEKDNLIITNNRCCAFCNHRYLFSIVCDIHNKKIANICKTYCSEYTYVGDTTRNLIILKEHLTTYNEVIS